MDGPIVRAAHATPGVASTTQSEARRGSTASQPDLSICIPTYRRPKLLERALRSTMAGSEATARDVEIVVSDNAPQETAELAQSILEEWPGKAAYLRNETNIGLVGNLNQCVSSAVGSWVLIVHDDDYLLPGAVDTILGTIRSADPSDHVFLFGVTIVDEEGNVLRKQAHSRDQRLPPPEALRRVLTDSSFVRFPAIVVRRTTYAAIGPFAADAEQATDFDMWIRLFAANGVRLIPHTVSAYTVHSGALTTGMFNRDYVLLLDGLFETAIAIGVLPLDAVRRAEREWFHQFLLAGTYRSVKSGDRRGARRVMALFDEPCVRSLGRSRHWLLIKIGMKVMTRLPPPLARPVLRLLGLIDTDARHWMLNQERA